MIPRTEQGSLCSTPSAAVSIDLLGGYRYESVTFSTDELRALERLYEFDLSKSVNEARHHAEEAHAAAVVQYEAAKAASSPWNWPTIHPPKPPDLAGAARWQRSGDIRNLMRHAEADGLRLIGAIARYLSPGEDPVKILLSLMAQAGFDVQEDPDWYNEEEEG